MKSPPLTPKLRGWIHQEAFFFGLGACVVLMFQSKDLKSLIGTAVFTFGLLFSFGVSTIYHRIFWEPKFRAILKRLDHSAIFVLIAGTFTPICLLGLSKHSGEQMLTIIWIVALLGIINAVFWVKAPKWLSGVIYVAMGWSILPYTPELAERLGRTEVILLATGGVAYTIGAIFYAAKRPNIKPGIFGYHELFHALTVLGAGLHFIVIYLLVARA